MSNKAKKKCFVIMPFGSQEDKSFDYWKNIFDNLIKPSVENASPNIDCYRAAEESQSGQITPAIIESLKNDFLCIADVTNKNANVYYELGLRDSWHSKTIIITQSFEDVVFDKKDHRAILYKLDDLKAHTEFNRKMKVAILDILDRPDRVRNTVQIFLDSLGSVKDALSNIAQITSNNAKSALTKSLMQLIPVMEWEEWPWPERKKVFDRFYQTHIDDSRTVYLILNALHPLDNQQQYISSFVKRIQDLTVEMFDSVVASIRREQEEVGSAFEITDFEKLVFLLPYAGEIKNSNEILNTLVYHFNDVRMRTLLRDHYDSTSLQSFSVENETVEFQIWDIEKLKSLEAIYRLTFSTHETSN